MKKILFIYNPVSGTGIVKRKMFEIVNFYNENDCLITLCPVLKLLSSPDAGNELQEYDRVVVCGGDGTLNNFLTLCSNVNFSGAVGYIPAGSTNDYAATLGLPGNFEDALKTTIFGHEQAIDIGRFNGNPFLYVAAFGIFTKVVYTTPQIRKNVMGHAAYILEGAKQLPEIQTYRLRLSLNDTIYEGNFLLGLVTNSISVGGMKNRAAIDIELDDGLFEVLFIKAPENLIEFNNIIKALTIESPHDCDNIIMCKTSHVSVEHYETTDWTLDGEYGGSHNRTDIVIENKKFKIIV